MTGLYILLSNMFEFTIWDIQRGAKVEGRQLFYIAELYKIQKLSLSENIQGMRQKNVKWSTCSQP